MKIPVLHDDQHGTAIIVCAAILNGLRVCGKDIRDVKLVTSGAGAAALACLRLLQKVGLPREHIYVTDVAGVVYTGRTELMDPIKAVYMQDTPARTLAEVIDGADIFLGLSAGGVLKPDMVARMAPRPLVLALANPNPEILPEDVKAVRDDAVIATGRSDYPNQVNNVLCFPFLFRGAMDVGATAINDEMKLACVQAIADLAMAETSDLVSKAYGGGNLRFGPEYLIPKPFDPRLIVRIAPAVARAAMDSGVATRPMADFKAYRQRLIQFVFQTGFLMKHVFTQAKVAPQRVIYADGEEPVVLQAVQQAVEEGLARPVLVGRRALIVQRAAELGLAMDLARDVDIIDPDANPRAEEFRAKHRELAGPGAHLDGNATAIGAVALQLGLGDALLCGWSGAFGSHLVQVLDLIGKAPGVHDLSTVNVLVLPSGTFFLCDTHVSPDPSAEDIVEMTLLAAQCVRRFGIKPRVALLSHSTFGSHDDPSATKMRAAVQLLAERDPGLGAVGEVRADVALSEEMRAQAAPNAPLKGQANLLIMPNMDAANIAYNLLKVLGGGVNVGPILLGAARPVHIVTNSMTVRGLINMTAMAVVEAQTAAAARDAGTAAPGSVPGRG